MRGERARRAAQLYASRRQRDRVFVSVDGGFGEPAWDMLLILYIMDAGGRQATIRELLAAAPVERQIAEPYIGWLVSRGLAAFGEGRETVRLLEAGREMMDAYLDTGGGPGHDRKFMH